MATLNSPVREQNKDHWFNGIDFPDTVAFDEAVTEGSLLVVCFSGYLMSGTNGITISDDKGNTWQAAEEGYSNGNHMAGIWYAKNAAAGVTTLTINDTEDEVCWLLVVLIEYSNVNTTAPIDQSNEAIGGGTSWDSGDITTTQADTVLIGLLAHDTSPVSLTEDSPWDLIFKEENQDVYTPISVSEIIATSTLTDAYTGSSAFSVFWYSAVVAFKAASLTVPSAVRIHRPRYRQDQQLSRPFRLNKNSPQAKGLVFWMPLARIEEYHDMVSKLKMTETNAPVWVSDAERGQALAFLAASTQYLENSSAMLTTTPVTMSAWFYPYDVVTSSALVCLGSSTGNWFSLIARGGFDGDYIDAATYENAVPSDAHSTSGFTANKWQHACGVFISNIDRRAYLDGGSEGTDVTDITPVNINRTSIGCSTYSDIRYDYSNANIADVRIYNRPLTPSEVYQLYDPRTRFDLYEPIPRVFPVAIEIIDGEIVRVPPLLRPNFEDRARFIAALQL